MKINGTNILVYCDGTLIASQKSCTVTWEQDLPGATTKDSSGWEEHINGVRRATCEFDGLLSTTGMSDVALMDYILNRKSLVLLIDGGGFPIIGEAKIKNIAITGPKEEPGTLSGSFKFNGPAWMLTGAYANLITDPDGTYSDYDTMTVSGIKITSAINAAGGANVRSNTFAVTDTSTYKLITFVTLTSGELPSAALHRAAGDISNVVTLVAGVNVLTLVAAATDTGYLDIRNSAAGTWAMTNIYLFKASK